MVESSLKVMLQSYLLQLSLNFMLENYLLQLLNGGKQFESRVGEKEENKTKNRFRNMVACEWQISFFPGLDTPH